MLSKSHYLAGLQCPKRLWYEVNAPAEIPPYDAATMDIFEQGHAVGRLARELYPGGIAVDRDQGSWAEAAAQTRVALERRLPIFEAAFLHEGAGCFVDLLVPAEGGAWDLLEVKSTTEQKNDHLDDLAFQVWIARAAGVRIRRSFLVHLDNRYVRAGELDLERLFVRVDLTDQVEKVLPEVKLRVAQMQQVCARSSAPEKAIGPHCRKPHECRMLPICQGFLPAESVLTLYDDRSRKWRLLARGIHDLAAIPDDVPLTDRQEIQRRTARSREAHLDEMAVRAFLNRLEYPIHYFDLESFNFAIPPFDGARPYQQIPFQFSLHIVDAPGAEPRQRVFLAETGGDPRAAFMAAAAEAIGPTGSVVAYNAPFERGRLLEGAALLPEHRDWVDSALRRLVDLREPFRNFSYYHPDQLGSASLKTVLPILAGRGYEQLEIQEGQAAVREFLSSVAPDTPIASRARIRQALLEYCARDTEGMHEVVEALWRIAGGDTVR